MHKNARANLFTQRSGVMVAFFRLNEYEPMHLPMLHFNADA